MRKLRKGDSYGFCFRIKQRPYGYNYKPTDPRLVALPLALIYLLGYILWSMLKHILSRPYSRFSLTILICIFCCCAANGQEGRTVDPETQSMLIGRRLPASFWTQEHLFFSNGDTIRKSLAEYKGKMLVLDFWSSSCRPCFMHQKEINHFKAQEQDLAVLLVNSLPTKDKLDKIQGHYVDGFFKQFGMDDFVSIVHDAYLMRLFPHGGFPSYVWINAHGVYQTHTYRNLLDRNYVSPFIDKL